MEPEVNFRRAAKIVKTFAQRRKSFKPRSGAAYKQHAQDASLTSATIRSLFTCTPAHSARPNRNSAANPPANQEQETRGREAISGPRKLTFLQGNVSFWGGGPKIHVQGPWRLPAWQSKTTSHLNHLSACVKPPVNNIAPSDPIFKLLADSFAVLPNYRAHRWARAAYLTALD